MTTRSPTQRTDWLHRPGLAMASVLLFSAAATLVAALFLPWGDSSRTDHVHVAQTVVTAGAIVLGVMALYRSASYEDGPEQTALIALAVALLAGASLYRLWHQLEPAPGDPDGAFLIIASGAFTVASAVVVMLTARRVDRSADRAVLAAGLTAVAVLAVIVVGIALH